MVKRSEKILPLQDSSGGEGRCNIHAAIRNQGLNSKKQSAIKGIMWMSGSVKLSLR